MFKGTWPPGQFQAVKTAPHHGPPVFIVEGETNLVSRCKKMTQKKSYQRIKFKNKCRLATAELPPAAAGCEPAAAKRKQPQQTYSP